MDTLLKDRPVVPTGSIKTFGVGPMYEVLEPIRALDDGDWIVGIRLVESGEETEYPLSHILNDPEAL